MGGVTQACSIEIGTINGHNALVGEWPEIAIIDREVLPELLSSSVRDVENWRIGHEFVIDLYNARAHYIYVSDDDEGRMCCRLIPP